MQLEKRIGAQYGTQRCAFGDGAQGNDPPSKFGPSAASVGGSWLRAASKRDAPNARATRSETRRWRESAPAALQRVRDMPEIVAIASFLWCAAPALQVPVDLIAIGALERALAMVESDSSVAAPSVGASAATVAGAALSGGGVASDGVLGGNLLDLVMTRLMCSATSIGRFASKETECVGGYYRYILFESC